MLGMGEPGFYAEMHDATGISKEMINRHYFVKEVKNRLLLRTSSLEGVGYQLIINTRGLLPEDQDKELDEI